MQPTQSKLACANRENGGDRDGDSGRRAFGRESTDDRARNEQQKRAQQPVESPELRKLYNALALDQELMPIPGQEPKPIAWKRIHKLPDFVYFDHRAHIAATVRCQTCHGPIETMERVRQFETLTMGWCVNCHRDVNVNGVNGKQVHASIDCVTCHY